VSAVAGEEEGSAVGQKVVDQIPRDRPLGVLHSGGRYLFGFGPNSYAIWDAAKEGAPVEEFPASKQGRLDGWRRYVEMEPAAQTIPPEQSPVREDLEEVETPSRRGGLLVGGGIALLLIVGLVVFFLTRSKNGGTSGPGGPIAGPKVTHLDITGAFTLSEDLKQKSFNPPVPGGFTRHMIASWTGAQMELKFDFDDPVPGDYTTDQLPRLRRLDFTITPPGGTKVQITSVAAECKVTIDHADTSALTGSIDCAQLTPPGSDQTIAIKGTFFAKA
jgi:hypothetical protein